MTVAKMTKKMTSKSNRTYWLRFDFEWKDSKSSSSLEASGNYFLNLSDDHLQLAFVFYYPGAGWDVRLALNDADIATYPTKKFKTREAAKRYCESRLMVQAGIMIKTYRES